MMTDTNDFTPYELLADKDLVLWGFRMVQYISEDGSLKIAWRIDGDVTATQIVGALEASKMRILIEESGEFDHFLVEDDIEDDEPEDEDE